MLFYKKDGFKKWSNPMLWRIIDDLKYKSLLRDMDISVSESVINTLTIIKLGNTAEGFAPTKEMFLKIADLLKTPSKSQTLIWSDLIDIITAYPPVEKILGQEKYQQVDNDIRQGLGISEAILGGGSQGSGKFANSFLSVKTLIERLEGARQALVEWIKMQFEIIAKAMDFKTPAWCKLEHINLSDEVEEKRLILELVDRGMLSYQTCVERFGENFDIEVQRMKREDRFRKANEEKFPYVLVKTGKFGPNLANGPLPFFSLLDDEMLQGMQKPEQTPTQQGGQGEKGGRPTGTPRRQKKSQTPRNKPQGQDNSGGPKGKAAASKLEIKNEDFQLGSQIFDRLYNSLSRCVMKSLNIKDAREIKQEQRFAIYNIVAKVIGEFDSLEQVTKENMEKLFSRLRIDRDNINGVDDIIENPEPDDHIFKVTSKLIEKFKLDHNKNPNKSEMKDIISSAFALSRSQNL
jgi:hypothetical protein